MSRETFRLNTRPLSLTRYPEYPLTFRHSSFSVMFSSLVFGSTLKPYGGRYSLSSYRWAHFVWAHFVWAHFVWAHFVWAHFVWAHFVWAHFVWAHFVWAHLQTARTYVLTRTRAYR